MQLMESLGDQDLLLKLQSSDQDAFALPLFSALRISTDHTSGQKLGEYSPIAAVANKDLAVGRIIEQLLQSPIRKESVVFILEDDAPAGLDHVDAHRSPDYIGGSYVKRNSVYSQYVFNIGNAEHHRTGFRPAACRPLNPITGQVPKTSKFTT